MRWVRWVWVGGKEGQQDHSLRNLLLTTFSSETLLELLPEEALSSSMSLWSMVLLRSGSSGSAADWSIISTMTFSSFWLANSSSQNSPDQITRISLRWQANTQTSPNMQGSEMRPKGKVTGAGMFTKTQAMPPSRKSTVAVTRQTRVLREESKRRRQESSIPGKTTAVMGSQAHFWLQVGLSVGNCSSRGKLYSLRKRLLQDCPTLRQSATTTASSKAITTRKVTPATLRLVNLSTLMRATHMQMLSRSLRMMLLPLKNQAAVAATPAPTLTHSITRTSNPPTRTTTRLSRCTRSRNSTSLVQVATPRMPRRQLRTQRQMVMAVQEKRPMTAPMAMRPRKRASSQQLTSMPRPPRDQGLEQSATTAIMTVTSRISRISPHSSVFCEQLSLQQTKQDSVNEVFPEDSVTSSTSKQFRQWIGSSQLLLMESWQPGGEQVLLERVGERRLYLVVRAAWAGRAVVMVRSVGVLAASSASVWKQVKRGWSEQSKKGVLSVKSAIALLFNSITWVTLGAEKLALSSGATVRLLCRMAANRQIVASQAMVRQIQYRSAAFNLHLPHPCMRWGGKDGRGLDAWMHRMHRMLGWHRQDKADQREVQLKGTSLPVSSSYMTFPKLMSMSQSPMRWMRRSSHLVPALLFFSKSSWHCWRRQEGTLVLRWWMWWYSMAQVESLNQKGTSRKVLPCRAAPSNVHFSLCARQGGFTECSMWKTTVPSTCVRQSASQSSQAGMPHQGSTHTKSTIDSIFSRKLQLRTPQRLPTTQNSPKNQTKGTVTKKQTMGSLKTRAAIFWMPFISEYCCLVKRMVCERSRRSRLPKCLWWWLCPSRQALQGQCWQMPKSLPTRTFMRREEKKLQWARSWNCTKMRSVFPQCMNQPTSRKPSVISTQVTTSHITEIPIDSQALRSSARPQPWMCFFTSEIRGSQPCACCDILKLLGLASTSINTPRFNFEQYTSESTFLIQYTVKPHTSLEMEAGRTERMNAEGDGVERVDDEQFSVNAEDIIQNARRICF